MADTVNRLLPRNFGLDLVRATEAAALAAGRWMGLGRPQEADDAASLVMQNVLSTIEMDGRIVIGEEGKVEANDLLRTGEPVGAGSGPAADVVVDPIDGRNLLAQGLPGAIAVAAVAPRGAMWMPTPAVYMEKIVVAADVAPALVPECMTAPAAWTLALVARVRRKKVSDLVVFVLDRPRHQDLITEIRAAGGRVMLRSDGDIAGALLAVTPNSGVDILMGVGGVPEGLIAACAVKATAGAMLGRLAPQSSEERRAVLDAGLDPRRVLADDQLVAGNIVFFAATGITDGSLLAGVHYHGERANSNSLILRGETRTRRVLHSEHLLADKALPL
jgi:fructose-1,6-bisphosphatase II